jgi:hypothetical protein
LTYPVRTHPASRDVIKNVFGRKCLSGRPFRPDVRGRRPDVRAHPRLPADAAVRPCGRVWTRVARPRARADVVKRPRGPMAARTRGHGGGNLGETLSFSYKGGSFQYISPTSNQARLNSWGLKRCVYTSFFPDWIAGFLVGSPLQTGGGGFVVLQDFLKLFV